MRKTHARMQRSNQGRLTLGNSPLSSTHRGYHPFVPGPAHELPAFVARHARPYDAQTDSYVVPAFDRDLVVDKAAPPKAIYDMHMYWSKKHWAAIREYIRHYLPESDYPQGTGLVLDCFSGSGMTGVAAQVEGRPCVLIDASPAAAFISYCYTHPVDPGELQSAYDRVMEAEYLGQARERLSAIAGRDIPNLTSELEWLYETRCDRCGGEARTEYLVYSERFQCPSCAEVVALFDCPEVRVPYLVGGRKKQRTELKKRLVCPLCLAHRKEPHRDFVMSTRGMKFGTVPVLAHFRCLGSCKPAGAERRHDEDARTKKARFFKDYDLAKLAAIDAASIPHWYPKRKMMDVDDDSLPWGTEWRPGRNFRNVADLYTRRNLWAQAAIFASIQRTAEDRTSSALRLALTGATLHLSRMSHHKEGGGGISVGTYYLPQLSKERLAIKNYGDKFNDVLKANEALSGLVSSPALVSQQPAEHTLLERDSVDYVFTDPAYVGKVQYGELNFVWESWLGFDGSWLQDEIVVNPIRGKSIEDWDASMRRVLANLFTGLKPGRWLSLCYHDTDPGTWAQLQGMLLDTGFEIHTVTVLDPKQKSSNQTKAEKVVKSDLVLNCRKPKPGEHGEGDSGESALVTQRVREILVESLTHVAGQSRDRLWDVVLKRLLARGQMAEHRFEDVLGEVAVRSESGRWFLKEEIEGLSENDIKNEESAGDAITRFARLRMAGVPASYAADIVLHSSRLADSPLDEEVVERFLREILIKDRKAAAKFELGGRLKGIEFYDCLFFYLTRWLKGRPGGTTPRRNLAEFLDEYLVRFKEGERWLYRCPDNAEAESLRKARQTGLGRRVRQFVAFLNGEGEFPLERIPDSKTLVAWLKHCAAFGLVAEGVALFEKGGLIGQLAHLSQDERYDAEDYYAQCRRRAGRATVDDEADEPSEEEGADE